MEEAEAYQRLIDEFGLTHDETAARVGKSRASVTNTLRLLQLPMGVQAAIKEGSLSAGHGRALLGTPDRALQEELCEVVIAGGLSVRATEELVRNGGILPPPLPAEDDETDEVEAPAAKAAKAGSSEPRRTAPKPLPAPGVLELEELLSNYLDTRVKVEVLGRRGRVFVDFGDIEDLERIYRLMLGTQRSSEA